jgi:hypothetical protein
MLTNAHSLKEVTFLRRDFWFVFCELYFPCLLLSQLMQEF